MAKKSTKKTTTEEVETDDEATAPVEQQLYGGEVPQPRDEPGITITGTENFGGKQGFIPAADAEKAGITVTGKGAAVAEEAPKGKGK